MLMELDGSGWALMVLAGYGWALMGLGWALMDLAGSGLGLDGSGWFWLDLAGSGWVWMGLDGSGWVWLDLDGSGWIWLGLAGSGWVWMGHTPPKNTHDHRVDLKAPRWIQSSSQQPMPPARPTTHKGSQSRAHADAQFPHWPPRTSTAKTHADAQPSSRRNPDSYPQNAAKACPTPRRHSFSHHIDFLPCAPAEAAETTPPAWGSRHPFPKQAHFGKQFYPPQTNISQGPF